MRGVPSFSHLTGLVAFMDVQWNFLPGHVNGPSNGPYLRFRGGSTALAWARAQQSERA
jgi:hypothetical protein